uniref:TRC8_N domain-containing protein n=1 Tax=Panagrellus redivivus TaxID=6233 RepID=A0A7E4UV46_PANRE
MNEKQDVQALARKSAIKTWKMIFALVVEIPPEIDTKTTLGEAHAMAHLFALGQCCIFSLLRFQFDASVATSAALNRLAQLPSPAKALADIFPCVMIA